MHRTTTISEFEELRSSIPEEEFELQKIIVSSKIKSGKLPYWPLIISKIGNMLSMDDVQDLLKKEESGEVTHPTIDENKSPLMHRVPSVREGIYFFFTEFFFCSSRTKIFCSSGRFQKRKSRVCYVCHDLGSGCYRSEGKS